MILLFSHSGFSDTEANGITIKNLLDAWQPHEKAEFYCNVSAPDFTAAHRYFRVTDVQMMKAFLGKKSQHEFVYSPEAEGKNETKKKSSAKKIPSFLKKQKYNFWIKWLRERMWCISPWGHRKLCRWVEQVDPEVVFYMVGESLFMDKKVLKLCKHRPLVLYHCEAFRIIDLKERKGLERAYYKKCRKNCAKLQKKAALVIYNSQQLADGYEAIYPKQNSMIAFNAADASCAPYEVKDTLNITYFGNLGVGRLESLLTVAKELAKIDTNLYIDVYAPTDDSTAKKLQAQSNIRYRGFAEKAELNEIMNRSDILLHVESFDAEIIPKLRYAFSTKIAQCLRAGRCLLSYAPKGSASSEYLLSIGMPLATDEAQLQTLLRKAISDPQYRTLQAKNASLNGQKNHDRKATAQAVRERVQALCRKDAP